MISDVNARVFELLAGSWRLDREISGIASFCGRAEFRATKEARVLGYTESGLISMLSGYSATASRQLRYCRVDDGIAIRDDDGIRRGATLHLLSFDRDSDFRLLAQHRLVCGRDVYDLVMTIFEPDRFETQYRVSGPRKGYRMLTIYTREATRSYSIRVR